MSWSKHYIISFSLILLAINLPAQNLTGTWEGALSNDQFLQLNIIQTGDKICGYTFDHVKADERSFCKAFFEGRFNSNRKILFINGSYFIKNSGSHTLMNIRLKHKIEDGIEILEQEPLEIVSYRERTTFFGIEIERYVTYDSTSFVYLKKVADQPYELTELMRDCIARDKKKTDSVVKKDAPPKDSMPSVVKIIKPENKTGLNSACIQCTGNCEPC